MRPLFPGKRFSFVRLGIALIVAACIVGGTTLWLNYTRTVSQTLPSSWFAGYVDVTNTPSYTFESHLGNYQKNVVLSFITASPQQQCKPYWGGAYSLDQANTDLDLDSRIAQTYKASRTVTVSFGGQAGIALAQACSSAQDLADAYQAVIQRYHVASLDFDIEGLTLDNGAAIQRMVDALHILYPSFTTDGTANTDTNNASATNRAKVDNIPVISLTLPVGTFGITKQGLRVVRTFLDAGIPIASVNAMTMDFNVPSTTTSQATLIKQALHATHDQYQFMLYQRGKLYSDHQIWQLMGATVLIGTNDTIGEYFTLDNAQEINTFALETGLGRLSMWSLNRDQQCGENHNNSDTLKTFCSGMEQTEAEFATTLSSGISGIPGNLVGVEDSNWTSSNSALYPSWQSNTQYRKGSKVIFNGNIYEALGTNENQQPDSAQEGIDAPWRLIGPVLTAK